jgi:hypothetical protein
MAKRAVDKTYSILVETEGQPVSKTFLLDKNVKLVTGLQITSNDPKLLFYRGSQRVEISGDELFPEDFESKILMSGLGVAPDNKYRSLGQVVPGNGEIKIQYKDSINPNAPFVPYKVTFIFLCEMK